MKLFLAAILIATSIFSQTTPTPCSMREAAQFDFWIGDWNLEWKDTTGKSFFGYNTITKEYGSCVIRENFRDSASAYFGMSVSMFVPLTGKWHQTWVDDTGSYLDFTGGWKDGKMTLSRSFVGSKGKTVMQRMVFSNMTKNEIDWNWENSLDGGKTWNLKWKIHYTRRG